jgi:hypothetical protein
MKLTEYKSRDVAGWHEANITEDEVIYAKNGTIAAAYFAETTPNIRFLINFVINGFDSKSKSLIPHGFNELDFKATFFGGLRTDGSIGRNACTIAGTHKDIDNSELLEAISILGELGVQLASTNSTLEQAFNRQKLQQKLLCDKNVCITDHYTSGSVNFDGVLEFHKDIASLPDVYNIIFYKKTGKGGHLILPEYDVSIDCKDYSMAVLRVKDTLHGVSKVIKGNRHSIVYYSVNGMT